MSSVKLALALACVLSAVGAATAQTLGEKDEAASLRIGQAQAEAQLKQTFTSLRFESFGPAPVKGPIYQANAGGRMVYYAPQSDHILFAAVYDRNGVNVTALTQDSLARKRLDKLDLSEALIIGPKDAPSVVEFTDPDCPYCQALDRYWVTKAAEGKLVRRHIIFVTGIHPQAAAKAEHILCAKDPEAAFREIYGGATPVQLAQCENGHARVAAQGKAVSQLGISGTPTLILDGKIVSGFRQGEIEAFLDRQKASDDAAR